MKVLIALFAFAMISQMPTANANFGIIGEVRNLNVLKLKDVSSTCPDIYGNGMQQCQAANPFYYSKCCNDTGLGCCFRPQDWAICAIGILVVLFIVGAIIRMIRCICCCSC